MLYQLVYVSEAATEVTDGVLKDILASSRKNNPKKNVTGLLLYQNGRFVQVLEGPKEAVEEIYSVIEKDARHEHVRVMITNEIAQREFGNWEMGFAHTDDDSSNHLQGISDFMDQDVTQEEIFQQKSIVMQFLKMFQHLTAES